MSDGLLRGTPRGSSGAVVESTRQGTAVRKTGDDRVVWQGQWLRVHACDALPEVYDLENNGYTMEMLNPLPRRIVDAERLARAMFNRLNTCVWPQQSTRRQSFNRKDHVSKVTHLLGQLRGNRDIAAKLLEYEKRIDWSAQIGVTAHGDPTIDNVMLRGTDIVIIDPLPSSTAVPDLRCVDLGKILQSIAGFENARYDELNPFHRAGEDWLKDYCGVKEIAAARYWCAVHLLRAIPYMPEGASKRVTQLFANVVRSL